MDPIIRMYLDRDADQRESMRTYRKPPIRFRASELAECNRQIWYRLSGYIPAPRTGFKDDWSIDGDIHHDIVRQLMLQWGIELGGITQDESGHTHEDKYIVQEFKHDGCTFNISSRQDGWIRHEDYDDMLLMEIKSVGHWVYNYMVKAHEVGFIPKGRDKPISGDEGFKEYIAEKKPSFIYQMNAGMAMHKVAHTYLVLKDRSNCHTGIHYTDDTCVGGTVFDFDPIVWDKVLTKCAFVKRKVLEGKPPIAGCTPSSKDCGYCGYYYLCHGAEKRRKLKLEPSVVYPDPLVGVELEETNYEDDT